MVNTTADLPSDGVCETSPGDCSLRDAVDDPLIAIVQLPGPTYTLGALGQLLIDRDVRIEGGVGADLVTIQSASGPDIPPHRVIEIAPDTEVELARVRISQGVEPSDNGGGILINSTGILLLSDSEIVNNRGVWGGGIWVDGELFMMNSLVASNRAETASGDGGLGGGIGVGQAFGAPLPEIVSMSNSTLSGNVTDGLGGGLFTRRSTSLIDVSIVDNVAPLRTTAPAGPKGAGLYLEYGPDPAAVMTARSALLARNGDANCGGTAADPVDSVAGMIDEAALPSCNVMNQDPTVNFVVADAVVGPLANNGGPTRTHALLAGSPAIDAYSDCFGPRDQRGVARPQGVRCDIGAFEREPTQEQPGGGQPPPPPPPEDEEELPPPVAGKNVNVEPTGTVKVKLPGSDRFVTLSEDQQLPVGTIVDATKGRVMIVAAGGQSAVFFDGIFKIAQGKGAKPLTTLTLVEKLSCPKAKSGALAAAKKKKRRLWGDGSGNFRVKGKHSAATVVGTRWLVEDRCTSTLTKVTKGKVSVRDFVKKKTVTVRAGKQYIAKARP